MLHPIAYMPTLGIFRPAIDGQAADELLNVDETNLMHPLCDLLFEADRAGGFHVVAATDTELVPVQERIGSITVRV